MILRKWEKENNNEYYCTKCGYEHTLWEGLELYKKVCQ